MRRLENQGVCHSAGSPVRAHDHHREFDRRPSTLTVDRLPSDSELNYLQSATEKTCGQRPYRRASVETGVSSLARHEAVACCP